jgi:hypothetical protein
MCCKEVSVFAFFKKAHEPSGNILSVCRQGTCFPVEGTFGSGRKSDGILYGFDIFRIKIIFIVIDFVQQFDLFDRRNL